VTTASLSRPSTVRGTLAEQFEPVLLVHAELQEECEPQVDADECQRRVRTGLVAYDALRMLGSCGDLRPRFAAMVDAFEVAGLISNDDRRALLDGDLDVDDLVSGWFTGDRTPRDARRRAARQAAILVGNALLRAASARVGAPSAWRSWTRTACPCCGGAPDIALIERGAQRTLVCARCDVQWRTRKAGCLGCEEEIAPAIARISNPELGYDLVMCNGCGRFLKERPRRGLESLIVERALTLEMEMAAEQRGLRI
jgi:hypothetical protein